MAQGICPACGWETLESVNIAKSIDRPHRARQTLVLLECSRCAWFGTASLVGLNRTEEEPALSGCN